MSKKPSKQAKRSETHHIVESIKLQKATSSTEACLYFNQSVGEQPVSSRTRAQATTPILFVKDPTVVERQLKQPSLLGKSIRLFKRVSEFWTSAAKKTELAESSSLIGKRRHPETTTGQSVLRQSTESLQPRLPPRRPRRHVKPTKGSRANCN